MKFVVGTPKIKIEEDTKVFFWLEEEDGEITLKVQREDDPDDYGYNVLNINSKGLKRIRAVGNDLGFPLDSNDRILLKE